MALILKGSLYIQSNPTTLLDVLQYILDIAIMVGTRDLRPNYHHIQYITISNISTVELLNNGHFGAIRRSSLILANSTKIHYQIAIANTSLITVHN